MHLKATMSELGVTHITVRRRNPRWFVSTTRAYLHAAYRTRRSRPIYRELSFAEDDSSSFAAVLPYGRICKDGMLVLTKRFQLLQDISFTFQGEHLKPVRRIQMLQQWREKPARFLGRTAAYLCSASPGNYFHWMLDVLPRLYLLEQSGIPVDTYIMNRTTLHAFHKETLAAVNISPHQILDARLHLQVKRLVVTSPITRYQFNVQPYVIPVSIPKWACHYLRSVFIPSELDHLGTAGKGRYLYISRRHAVYRKVVNEPELTEALSTLGFKVVQLEHLRHAEQVQLFVEAAFIVAPHGAGLTNTVFCRPGTRIIELFASNYTPSYYEMISAHMGLDYHRMVSEPEEASLDFRVNPEDVLKLIR
ncbi:glycosyltransferase family 61 protein [Paenibacillus sp. F411]|uniref:glycosyltransferase family 61 protein n=1 Tax=Paenibacillus sp. F411 TaxID=2820239 RepID=UPI001AAF1D09|nr:glycosyltransferase family 61 protein [Paenibacillus sp. F411]